MPFLAKHEGEFVLPPQVDDEAELVCPKCDEIMGIKDGPVVARHFFHSNENSECSGESPEHLRMKSIAYSNLSGAFPDAELDLWFDEEVEVGEPEYPDAEVELERGIGERRADIRVTFETPRSPEGKGIGVEIQHRHEDKDIEDVTVEYLEDGYSVLWLDSEDFDGYDVDLSGVITVWPSGVLHDFSGGYHKSVQELQKQEQVSERMNVVFPPDIFDRYESELRQAWEHGQFRRGSSDESFDFCYEWLSGHRGSREKWIRVSETPEGDTVLQIGKGGSDSPEQVTAPIKLNNPKNRGKVHSLAYAVEECEPSEGSEWEDLEKVWLDSGFYNTNVLLKLVSAPRKSVCLSLGVYGDGNEFITVAPDTDVSLKSVLHAVAEELG